MKKLLLSLLIGIISLVSKSQIRIGFTTEEIAATIKLGEKLDSSFIDNGSISYVLTYKNQVSYFTRRYYFDQKDRKCFLYVVEPYDRKAMIEFVEYCNKNYEKVTDRRWQTYFEDKTIDIKLEYVPSVGKNLFYFKPKT